jgi:hypothetical protein
VDASNHDVLVAEQRLQAIAGQAVGVEDQRWRSFLAATAAAGHHHVLGIGQFGQPIGAPKMCERRAAADHFHQSRHFAINVGFRYEAVANGCRQGFDGDPNLCILDVGDRCQLVELHVLAGDSAPGAMLGRSRAR